MHRDRASALCRSLPASLPALGTRAAPCYRPGGGVEGDDAPASTSGSTRRADEQHKRDVYASLGVSEYFLYDPRAEYLAPPLQGWRLHDGKYRRLPAATVLSNRGVAVASEVLGLELRDDREARMVRLRDPATGDFLLSHRESELAREEEAAARREAEARVRELERALAASRKSTE